MSLKLPRGPEERVGLLENSQVKWVEDTEKLIIGGRSGNIEMAKQAELDEIENELNNARGGLPALGERLDEVDERLDTVDEQLATVDEQLALKAEQAQTDSLQNQINIMALQGTSGDSSAEVAQARVNLDGSTFPTTKAHLDDMENKLKTGVSKYQFGGWVQGGINSDGTNNDTSATLPIRIRTAGFQIPSLIPIVNGVFTAVISSGFSASFCFYTDATYTTQTFSTGWVTGTYNVPLKSNYLKITMKYNLGANINASQGSGLIYVNYNVTSFVINDTTNSDRTTYSSNKLNSYLTDIYGYQSITQTEADRHILRVNDLEKSVNLRNVAIDDFGNMSAEIVNTNKWAELYTEKDNVKFDFAINNNGWIMYNKTGSTILMMPLVGANKGYQYTLTEDTLTSVKSSNPIVTIGSLWNTATNSSVFTLERIGTTLNIYMAEGVGSTLVATLTGCNVVGFISSSTFNTALTTCYVTITKPKVLAKGLYQKVYELENQISTGSADTLTERFKAMKVMCTGDSITEVNFRASTNWVGYINSWFNFALCTNDGKSGTGLVRPNSPYKNFIDRVDDWGTGYDMILIMGNMNDYSDPSYFTSSSLGTLGDTTTATQYGAVDTMIQKLINKYPNASIGWIISTPRQYQASYASGTVLTDGYLWGKNSVFENASKAIKDVCGKYSIPVLDLFHESGLRPWNATNRQTYFSCTQAPDGDGVHPNDLGHKLLSYKIYEFIKQYM